MKFEKILPVNNEKLLKALHGNSTQKEIAENAAGKVLQAAKPMWVYKRFSIDEDFVLPEINLVLTGQSIKKYLLGLKYCYLFCVTLGTQLDAALRSAAADDMLLAYIMDVAASILAEQYTQLADDELSELAKQDGMFCTKRFSPGYGDIPLNLNYPIAETLNAFKAINLSVQNTGIIIPQKSVIAIKGISHKKEENCERKCTGCVNRNNCVFLED
jgi:hypothetical protein